MIHANVGEFPDFWRRWRIWLHSLAAESVTPSRARASRQPQVSTSPPSWTAERAQHFPICRIRMRFGLLVVIVCHQIVRDSRLLIVTNVRVCISSSQSLSENEI